MKENIIQKKSYDFAIQIIGLYKELLKGKNEYVLSKQILRSIQKTMKAKINK